MKPWKQARGTGRCWSGSEALPSEPLPRFHQAEVEQLARVPFEGHGIVPAEAMDIEGRTGVRLERLGGAEGTDSGGQVVVPFAAIGVHFLVIEGEIRAQHEVGLGLKQGNAVDLAPGFGDVFLIAPAQPAKEIELAFLGVVMIVGIGAGERVVA